MKKSIAQLKRDSRMLDSLMGMIAEATYRSDKHTFTALVDAWRQGHRANDPLEQALLRGVYKEATIHCIGDTRIDVPHAAMAHMIREMYPEVTAGEEGKR